MKDSKILKSFRLYPEDIKRLEQHSKTTGLAQTRIVERALDRYFKGLAEGQKA